MQRRIRILVCLLLVTAGAHAVWSRPPETPTRRPLAEFPGAVGSWKQVGEGTVSDAIAGVLKSDDYLLRSYRDSQGRTAEMFVAYYAFQQAGETMHSPKNCLPGWGWKPVQNDHIALASGSDGRPIEINRYIVEKDGRQSVVLYWYQAHGRVIASEYAGKAYLVWDALRYNRRDGSLVRFVVPVPRGGSVSDATRTGLDLAAAGFQLLPRYLPN
jgi:EpsI family protein